MYVSFLLQDKEEVCRVSNFLGGGKEKRIFFH